MCVWGGGQGTASLSYLVCLKGGELWRRHIDHLRDGTTISLPTDNSPNDSGFLEMPETLVQQSPPPSATLSETSEQSSSPAELLGQVIPHSKPTNRYPIRY